MDSEFGGRQGDLRHGDRSLIEMRGLPCAPILTQPTLSESGLLPFTGSSAVRLKSDGLCFFVEEFSALTFRSESRVSITPKFVNVLSESIRRWEDLRIVQIAIV